MAKCFFDRFKSVVPRLREVVRAARAGLAVRVGHALRRRHPRRLALLAGVHDIARGLPGPSQGLPNPDGRGTLLALRVDDGGRGRLVGLGAAAQLGLK